MLDSDPRLKRILAALEERPSIDVAPLVVQLKRLASNVPSVRVRSRDMEDMRLLLSSNRSRVVAIRGELLLERLYLENVRARVVDHLYARYVNFMSKNNERQRKALVANAVAPLTARIDPLARTMEFAENVLGDYDSRAFAFRDVVSALHIGDRER